MVLGASGKKSAETFDDDSLTYRTYQSIFDSGAQPSGTIIDEGYPYLKLLMTANAVKRQKMLIEQKDEAEEDELSPEQHEALADIFKRNPKVAEEWTRASPASGKVLDTPTPNE